MELIVVDDSDDDTPQAFADSAARSPLPVRLLHRRPGARKGGLSSAVIAGARWARGQWVLVMDADLQHPPEAAAMLASTAVRHDSDIVVGTRYAGNGSPADGLSSKARTLVSSWSTWLAKTLFPRRLAMMTDPLSGLFAFRRAAVNLDALRPTGFKILLEILVRNPRTSVAEVAYRFAARHAGRSKASLQQGLTFLGHLARLRGARLAGQLREGPRTRDGRINEAARFVGFGLLGLTGIVVNTAALWLFYHELSLNHLLGASLATQVSTGWNFLLVRQADLPQPGAWHPGRPGDPFLPHEQPAAACAAAGARSTRALGHGRAHRERCHAGPVAPGQVRAQRPGLVQAARR